MGHQSDGGRDNALFFLAIGAAIAMVGALAYGLVLGDEARRAEEPSAEVRRGRRGRRVSSAGR